MGAITKIFRKKQAPAPEAADTSSPIYQQQVAENNKTVARRQIEGLFGDPLAYQARQKMYKDASGAARDLNMKYLTEDRNAAADALKLQLARQGLGGGAVDIEQNAQIGRKFNEGVTDIGAQTDAMTRALAAQDEQTKLEMLNMIDAGMDGTTAVNNATSRLNTAANNAIAQSRGRMIGNLFTNLTPVGADMAYGAGQQSTMGSVPMPGGMAAGALRPRNRTFRW
jgi:hypothetical protein